MAVWNVPVYPDDPVRGKQDALVTIVVFSELEAATCREAARTLDALLAELPNDVRLVWKDQPLPFDARARPAALFGRAVYRALGNDGFWRANALLFAAPGLQDSDLEVASRGLGLPESLPATALKDTGLAKKVEQSLTLGFDVQAKGMPHFFINGVRLAGAQPLDKLKSRVEEALDKAKTLVSSGVPPARVYETLMAGGKQLPALERREAAPPASTALRLGDIKAPVVVQFWSAFPCTDCIGAVEQLRALETEYTGRVQAVLRISTSGLASEATREAFVQQGTIALQAWHDRFADTAPSTAEDERRRSRVELEKLAEQSRFDLVRFKAALDAHRHQSDNRMDTDAARQASIVAPAVTVNGYFLPGAPSTFALRRAVQHALNDAANAPR